MRNGILFLFVLLAVQPLTAQNAGTLVSGSGGMVVTASAEASQVGIEILRAGGNAVDAAVAVGFALAVTYPSAGNIGGGCYIVIRMADGREAAIDARETAPGAAHRDMYLDSLGMVIPEASLVGPLAAGVPGSVHGMLTALEAYGSMPRPRVLDPAIRLASEGFPLHARLARHFELMAEKFARFPETERTFTDNGKPLRGGDLWRQPDLARTLTLIRDRGTDGFYRGETAERIAAAMRADGGIISTQDLARYTSIIREPLRGTYRGCDILSMPPSSSGGVALLQMLGMLEHTQLSSPPGSDAASVHYMVESMRRVFADRAKWMGDPEYVDMPLDRLLSRDYARAQYDSIANDRATSSAELYPGLLPREEGNNTTHYSIVDRWGNAVAVTTTINSTFGSLYVVPGAGFLLNNEMDDFSVRPGVPNQFGLLGSEANSIQPGKRMLSSMTPTIVLRGDNVYMVTGSPGGSKIITTVLQSIVHVVDAGWTVDRAVSHPRLHHQWYPDVIDYEEGALDPGVIDTLRGMGHACRRSAEFGRCDAIVVDHERGEMHGCSDPRGNGAALVIKKK